MTKLINDKNKNKTSAIGANDVLLRSERPSQVETTTPANVSNKIISQKTKNV